MELYIRESQFNCELEQGTSQLCTYNNKFEVTLDFREFKKENIRVQISQDGIINVKVLSRYPQSSNKEILYVYDENIFIPKHERAIKNCFICQMNENGVVRITGTYSLNPKQDQLMIFSETSKENRKQATTKVNGLDHPKLQPQNILFEIKPLYSEFEYDAACVLQEKLEFEESPDKSWRTLIDCSSFSSRDIKIEIVNNQTVRISKKSKEDGSFIREICLPNATLGWKVEDLKATFNQRGILRFVAETDESRYLGKPKGIILPRLSNAGPIMTMIKPKIIGDGRSNTRTKAVVNTPWGERVTTVIFQPVEIKSEIFEANIMAQEYLPEEIQIRISDGWLTISGKKLHCPNKTFTEKIEIPDSVNPESIICGMDGNTGMIYISTSAISKRR